MAMLISNIPYLFLFPYVNYLPEHGVENNVT